MVQKINSKHFAITLLLMLFLASCKLGKEYPRPEVELPAAFSPVSFSDTSSIADIEWKNFFNERRYAAVCQQLTGSTIGRSVQHV